MSENDWTFFIYFVVLRCLLTLAKLFPTIFIQPQLEVTVCITIWYSRIGKSSFNNCT